MVSALLYRRTVAAGTDCNGVGGGATTGEIALDGDANAGPTRSGANSLPAPTSLRTNDSAFSDIDTGNGGGGSGSGIANQRLLICAPSNAAGTNSSVLIAQY